MRIGDREAISIILLGGECGEDEGGGLITYLVNLGCEINKNTEEPNYPIWYVTRGDHPHDIDSIEHEGETLLQVCVRAAEELAKMPTLIFTNKEWNIIQDRRHELITKEFDCKGGLTKEEKIGLSWLQRIVTDAVDQRCSMQPKIDYLQALVDGRYQDEKDMKKEHEY